MHFVCLSRLEMDQMSHLSTQSLVSLVLLAICIPGVFWSIWKRSHRSSAPQIRLSSGTGKDKYRLSGLQSDPNAYHNIDPLADFEWSHIEPLQLRPFKSRFHLTMGLENSTISDLVLMDNTYLDRIHLRRQLLQEHDDAVVLANDAVLPAAQEFYTWIIGTYLPQRFPLTFQIEAASPPSGSVLRNTATGETINLDPPEKAQEILRIINNHVDTDFFFLLRGADDNYFLQGYINAFPSGFDSRQKINLKLADIHGPVPGYAAKLEKSMDRYFAALPVGKVVKRANWTVTTHPNLFTLGGNHIYDGEAVEDKDKPEDVRMEQCRFRAERQTLHRLPQSGAIVFGFKTYTYPLSRLREDGSAEALCAAIDGILTGSAPAQMAHYKRQVVWGEPVKQYLRR